MKTKSLTMRHRLRRGLVLASTAGLLTAAVLVAAPASAQDSGGETQVFLALDPVSVTILDRSRVAGFLAVTFSLSPAEAVTESRIRDIRPRLRDSVIRNLSSLASRRIDVTRPVNLDLVRRYIQTAVDLVLGADRAVVVIQSASIQKL